MTDTPLQPLAPGGRIGILGSGQLGRMIALAAAPLGYSCHIYAPDSDHPAGQVSHSVTQAPYDDEAALARFADAVDVITYEFENIPAETVAFLNARKPVRPGLKALATAQDRLNEKNFATEQGIGAAPYSAVDSLEDLQKALSQIGTPAVLKTRRFGYDGKGQFRIDSPDQAAEAWQAVGESASILEGFVNFTKEVSIIAARDLNGNLKCYPLAENEHRHHILYRTQVPATVSAALMKRAEEIITLLLNGLDYVGVLAVELFVTAEDELLFNEIAPRVHNSGHWTQDGAVTSQFEQHVRAICGLPLGDSSALGQAEMINLVGDEAGQWLELLAEPGTHLHLYGKAEARPGRKMGHINRLLK